MELIETVNFNVNIAIIIAFLGVNLAVGVYYGRGVKTMQDYALGGRNFSTGALVATIVSTWIGGDYLFITLAEVYTTGLHYAVGCLGMAACLLLNAFVFAPKMGKYLGSLSVAEAMGKLYGKQIRIITAIAAAIATSGFIAVQFKIFGFVLNQFMGFEGNLPIFFAAAIVVAYSAFGGIRSVTFTDVIQFFTFGVILPLLGVTIWYSCINQPDFTVFKALDNPIFDFKTHFSFSEPKFWSMISLFLLFSIPDINPPIFQRFSIGRNVEQVRKAFAYSALLIALILISMSWISFLLLNVSKELDPNKLVQFIMENYSGNGLGIFILIGIVSMCMSSADSNINSASVVLTHDFCNVLNIKLVDELFLSKFISVLLGIVAFYLATLDYDLLPLVFLTQNFYIPIIDVPLILAILGFKSSVRAVLIGMVASLISVFIWRFYFMESTGVDSILPATIVNLIFFLSSHYILKEKGGWEKKIPKTVDTNNFAKTESINNFNIILFLKKNIPINPQLFVAFGIFCIISTICSMYSISISDLTQPEKSSLIHLYEYILVTAVCFMLYPMWPEKIKNNQVLISVIWNVALLYILVFCSTYFTLLSKISHSQFVIFVLNITVLAVLTRWKLALTMIFTGIVLAIYYFKTFIGVNNLALNLNSTWLIFYTTLLSAAAIIMFLKPKQEQMEEAEAKVDGLESEVGNLENVVGSLESEVGTLNETITDLNVAVTHYSERVQDQLLEIERLGATAQKILNNVNHELRLPVGNVMNFAEMLSEGLEKYSKEQLKMLSDEVFKNSNRLSTMILNMLDLATLDVKKIDLNKKNINLSELVEDRVNHCRKVYLEQKPLSFEMNIAPDTPVFVDPNYIRQTIDNLVINAINYSQSGTIKISVQPIENNKVEIIIQDQGIGIPKGELFDIFTPFKMGSKTDSKAQGRGVGLALCKSAIEAHEGTITVESNGTCGALFRIILNMRD